MLIKPFALLAVLGMLVLIRYGIIKYMPDGWLKRLFLIRLDKPRDRSAKRSA